MRLGFLFFLICVTSLLRSQTTFIEGQLVNEEKVPLEKVLVQHLKTNTTVTSNQEGLFFIEIPTSGTEIELQLSLLGYQTILLPVNIKGQRLNLGEWVLIKERQEVEEPLNLVDFDEISSSGLDEGAVVGGGLLQSRRTVFLEAVSFQFSSAFFSQRGMHRRHQTVYVNGLKMEEFDRGVAPWSHWSGLNDITNRSQLVDYGLASRGNNFGGVLGSVELFIRPSNFSKRTKISQAFSNRTYQSRSMITFHSSLGKDWRISGLGSFRNGETGFQEGTPYYALGGLLSLEKIWKGKTSTWITLWYTPVERGRTAPITQEVFDLKGNRYNPYWGVDQGERRNARMHRAKFPYLLLNQAVHFSDKVELLLSGGYSLGEQADSRLLYTGVRPIADTFVGGGKNPDPVYYQNLPSYFLRDRASPNIEGAYYAQKKLEESGQIQWGQLRNANASIQDGFARYMLYDDMKQVEMFNARAQLFFDPKPNAFWKTTFHYRESLATYFAQPTDFLGATQWYDIDPYAESQNTQQNDLNNPSSIVRSNEKFQYFYEMAIKGVEANSFWSKQWRGFRLFLGTQVQFREYQRKGRFQNGAFPENSFGLGERVSFRAWTSKGGMEVSLSPRHQILLYGGVFQRPPSLRSVYPNPRENNQILPGLVAEETKAIEVAYRWQGKQSDMTLKGYWNQQKNGNEVSLYFADGVGGDEAFFIQEVLQGKESLHKGLELGFKHTFVDVLDLKIAAAFGKHQYTNSPNLLLYTEPSVTAEEAGFAQGFKSFGKSNLKGYHLSNGPQQAYSVGLQYNDPDYWRINLTGNYFSHTYLQPNPLRRTESFLLGPLGLPLSNVDQEQYKRLLQQEQFPAFFVLNATAGKSWKIKQNFMGFFASFQNLLNATYKTGGFEQGRNANFNNALEDHQRDTPIFSPKYWWSRGPTFFISTYFSF